MCYGVTKINGSKLQSFYSNTRKNCLELSNTFEHFAMQMHKFSCKIVVLLKIFTTFAMCYYNTERNKNN